MLGSQGNASASIIASSLVMQSVWHKVIHEIPVKMSARGTPWWSSGLDFVLSL